MQEDGITFVDDTLQPTMIMSSKREDDEFIVEGPSLLFQNGTGYYYLFFSAGNLNDSNYHVNVARSPNLLNYFDEVRTDFLHAGLNSTFVGPGHGTPVRLDNGDVWYVYHAWNHHMESYGGLHSILP